LLGHELARAILSNLKKRYEKAEEAHTLSISTMLDPRFKNKLFKRPDMIARTMKFTRDLASVVKQRDEESETENVETRV